LAYRIASQIAFVEVHRAVRRATTVETIFRRAEEVLSITHSMDIHQGILGDAALLDPKTVRSLALMSGAGLERHWLERRERPN
jgi:hypothetical protein